MEKMVTIPLSDYEQQIETIKQLKEEIAIKDERLIHLSQGGELEGKIVQIEKKNWGFHISEEKLVIVPVGHVINSLVAEKNELRERLTKTRNHFTNMSIWQFIRYKLNF